MIPPNESKQPAQKPAPKKRPPYVSPYAAKRALRFEPKELPAYVLEVLDKYGDLARADITQAAFGKTPTRDHKVRANSTIDALLKNKLIRSIGRPRHYTFGVTAKGKRQLATAKKAEAASG